MIHHAPKAEQAVSFPTRTIGIGLAIMIAMLLVSTFLTWRVGDEIRTVMDSEVEVLTSAQKVEHYGTILEMSVKAVVNHGDSAAAAKYRALQPELRTTLTTLRNQVPSERHTIAVPELDRTDLALVAMEYEALDLVSRGDFERAWRIINSDKYNYLVDIYVKGIRGIEQRASHYVEDMRTETNLYLWMIVALSGASLLLVVLGWFALIRPARRWGNQLDRARMAAEFSAHQLQAKQEELEVLNRKFFEQARTDPLTGLSTRLRFNEDIEALWPKIERRTESYCAMMCDVDFFKQYNDTYGHLAGDVVLKRVATALDANRRAGDQLYRMGGEEFLVILHGCEARDALARAEHYRAAVEELNILHSGSHLKKVTLSIGTSCLGPERSASLQVWLGEADVAMYEAKAAGRNAVVAGQQLAA